MKTTLKRIKNSKIPIASRIKLYKQVKTTDPGKEISAMELYRIMGMNGIKFFHFFEVFDFKDYCLFLVDVIDSTTHIYKKTYKTTHINKILDMVKKWHSGKANEEELREIYNFAEEAVQVDYEGAVVCENDGISASYYICQAARGLIYYILRKRTPTIKGLYIHVAKFVISYANAPYIYAGGAVAPVTQGEREAYVEELFIKHFGGGCENNNQTNI